MTDVADGSRTDGGVGADGSEPAIELRVHGVGGTGPEVLLGNPHVVRVSGDRDAGFYRPASGPGADRQEALSWGGLTSRDASRALWLVLLPFALVNMAGWMQLPRPGEDHSDRTAESGWESPAGNLVRLFGLSMTLLLVLATAALGLDLIAYQCGRSPCASQQWWTAPLEPIGPDRPAARLAVGALMPLAALLLVWFAGLRSYRRLENFEVPEPPSRETRVGLEHRDFWRSAEPVARLRNLHLTGGLTTIALLLAWSATVLDGTGGERVLLGGTAMSLAVGQAIAALSVLLLAVVAIVLCRRALVRRIPNPLLKRSLRALMTAGGLLLVLAVGYAIAPRAPWQGGTGAPNSLELFVTAAAVLAAGQLVLVAGMLVLWWSRRSEARGAACFGLGQPFLCLLASVMLASLWAGSFIRLADTLGTPLAADVIDRLAPGALPWEILVYPPWYRAVSVGFSVTLGALVAAILLEAVRLRLGVKARASEVRRDFWPQLLARFPALDGSGDPDQPLHALPFARERPEAARRAEQRVTEVAWSYGLADIVRRADRWLLLAVAFGLIGAALEVWLGVQGWLLTGSTWLVATVPLFGSATMFGALRSPERRRGIAVLFDVLTFWPRHHHPFAPPCYGERVIPQLAARLRRLTGEGQGPGRVVLSAHSQGTVIAAACLLQDDLPPATRERVDLLTYGSPLVILYQRAFPAYFGAGTLRELRERLRTGSGVGHWKHYYCPTDPLGAPMFSAAGQPPDPDDHRLLDPRNLLASPGEPPPVLLRHSAYLDHPELTAAVADLCAREAPKQR